MTETSNNNWTKDLVNSLASLCDSKTHIIPTDKIDLLINEFIECVGSFISSEKKAELTGEVKTVLTQVRNLKLQTLQMSEDIVKDNFIPDISLELNSVITQTEKSVGGILDVSDIIQKMASSEQIPENIKAELTANSTKLLELCNFQDLTGQIINRIIKRLTTIESTINNIYDILKLDPKEALANAKTMTAPNSLLNGPQSEEERPSQSEINDLFSKL